MKRIIFLLMFSTFTLFSCSNSDDATTTQSSINGKWHTISAKENGVAITLTTCDLYGYTEFLTNNTCVLESGYYNGSTCVHDTSNGTYTFSDNVLTFKANQYESRSRIAELTKTNLKITTYYTKEGNTITNIPENEQRTYTLEKND